jgi:1-acyl-sn-glycerol-3-phosphate acyltransferase
VDPSVLQQLEAPVLKGLLPGFLASQVMGADRAVVARYIADWTDRDYEALLAQLKGLGQEYRVYPAIPCARELARRWMRDIITPTVVGCEHLRGPMDRGPTVIVTNHISYLDATATDVLVSWAGHADLADRIAYLAGPKVYQELFRLVAAAAIHTLPVPQSNQLAHTEQLSARELARRALSSMEAGQAALAQGHALLFYPEGSRTRTGRLEPFLKATRRYLQSARFVVPGAIDGTDRVMPLDGSALVPGPVSLTFGAPIALQDGESARDALATAHEAIAAMLPAQKRPGADSPRLH